MFFFKDNEGARFALIKANRVSLPLPLIVQLFHDCSEHDTCWPWIERVPSQSNIADLPSRDRAAEALSIIGGTPWEDGNAVLFIAELCKDFRGIPNSLQHVGLSKYVSHLDALPDKVHGD